MVLAPAHTGQASLCLAHGIACGELLRALNYNQTHLKSDHNRSLWRVCTIVVGVEAEEFPIPLATEEERAFNYAVCCIALLKTTLYNLV